VLILVAKGHRNTEIAERLGISTKAVEFHRTRLKRVLGVSNTAGLVRFALSRGLTGPHGPAPPEA
jgi:DNA-binding CsgD family transcriptional regulator